MARFFTQKFRSCFSLPWEKLVHSCTSHYMAACTFTAPRGWLPSLLTNLCLSLPVCVHGWAHLRFVVTAWSKAWRRVLSLDGLSTKKVYFSPFSAYIFCPVLHHVLHMGNNNHPNIYRRGGEAAKTLLRKEYACYSGSQADMFAKLCCWCCKKKKWNPKITLGCINRRVACKMH